MNRKPKFPRGVCAAAACAVLVCVVGAGKFAATTTFAQGFCLPACDGITWMAKKDPQNNEKLWKLTPPSGSEWTECFRIWITDTFVDNCADESAQQTWKYQLDNHATLICHTNSGIEGKAEVGEEELVGSKIDFVCYGVCKSCGEE